MKHVLGLCAVLLLSGCSVLTDGDRQLAKDILAGVSGCVYIQGSGGGGAGAIPPVPIGGAYGQGSLSVARSQRPDAKMSCSGDGAKVD